MTPKNRPTKMFLVNAAVYILVGVFGIVVSLQGAQGAAAVGAPVMPFRVGTAGAAALLLLGIGLLIWVRSQNVNKG